jgi:hypothetical protein
LLFSKYIVVVIVSLIQFIFLYVYWAQLTSSTTVFLWSYREEKGLLQGGKGDSSGRKKGTHREQ